MQDEKLWETKTQNGASSKASILRVGNHRQKNRSKDPFTGLLPQGGQKGNTRKNVKRAKPAQAHGESAELSPAAPRPRGSGPESDTFGGGNVAEADLGWLVAVLIGAFSAAAGSPGRTPAPGCHILRHGKVGWVWVGSERTDVPGFWPAAE